MRGDFLPLHPFSTLDTLCYSEAINAARERDEAAVMFALFMAPTATTLDTKNLDHQTVLHVAAELLDAQLVRAFMTKGADGAVADVWGN